MPPARCGGGTRTLASVSYWYLVVTLEIEMFCAKCGTKQPDGSKFCVKCGTDVTGGVATDSPPPTSKSKRTWVTIVGWFLVAGAVALPFMVSDATTLSIPFLWIGFALVFPGKSVIVRAGKGLVAMFVVMVAIFLLQDHLPTGASTSAKVQPAREVPLSTLLGDYAMGGNEIAADQKYKGQVVRTSGILNEVKKDITDQPYVIVGLNMGLNIPNLQCTLAKSAVDEAVSLKPGQQIVVQGEIRGLMLNVQAGDCVFVKPASATSDAAAAQASVRQAPAVSNAQAATQVPDPTTATVVAAPTASPPPPVVPAPAIVGAPANEVSTASNNTAGQASASFDCAKAAADVEKLICSNSSLAADDVQLASFYKRNIAASGADAATIKQGQRAFIATRNKCSTVACISEAYRARYEELGQMGYVRE
jgi:uncharacterized protein YecT (DUF1311 family)